MRSRPVTALRPLEILHTAAEQAADTVRSVLLERVEPEAAVAELAELVHRAGAPDNVVFVVADVLAA